MKIRLARVDDIPAMQRIRHAVKENRLVSRVISDEDVLREITETGRGWVGEVDGDVRGFSVARHIDGNIWALFVEPEFEGLGLGRALHLPMLEYLREKGCRRAWLETESGTRAEHFYRLSGWRLVALSSDGDARFERDL